MSGKALHWAYQQGIKPGPKYLLTAMADVADDDGFLDHSHEYLAHKTCVSARSVASSMKDLEDYGLILRERVVDQDGEGKTTAIFLLLENQLLFLPKWDGPVAGTSRKRNRDRPRNEVLLSIQEGGQHAPISVEVVEIAADETSNSEGPGTMAESKTVIDDSKSSATDSMPARAVPSQHRGADLTVLAHRLTPLIGAQPSELLRWIIDEALSTATRTVAHPVAYVVKCVQRDPDRYTPTAARRRHSGPTTLLGPGEVACAREGHESYPAAHCAACRTDALTEGTNDTTEPVMRAEELAQWRHKRQEERANRAKVRQLTGSFGGKK